MKNILVPTDFSKHAFTAAAFAAELARMTGARMVLFHAYHPSVLLEEETIWADTTQLEKEVQQKMDELAQTIHSIYGISITRLLRPGFAVDEIQFIAQKLNPDLVIMGTDGAGTRLKESVGKVTAEVLKRTKFPLLSIPPDASFESYLQLTLLPEPNQILGNAAGLQKIKELNPILKTTTVTTVSATS